MAAELILLLFFLVAGMLITPARGVAPWARPAFAFVCGASIHVVAAGAVVMVGGTGGSSPLLVGTAIATAIVVGIRVRSEGVAGITDSLKTGTSWFLMAGAMIAAMAVATRSIGLVSITPDSIQYLVGAQLLADGDVASLLASPDTLRRRMIAPQLLHAPAVSVGSGAAVGLGPSLFAAAVVITGWLTAKIAARNQPGSVCTFLGWSAAAFVATTGLMMSMATYINSHMFVSAALLSAVGAAVLWLDASPDLRAVTRPWIAPAALLLAALALARPEGALLATVLLVPIAALGREYLSMPRVSLVTIALATAGWNLLVARAFISTGGRVPVSTWMMLALAFAMVLAAVSLPKWSDGLLRRLPAVTIVALWLGVCAYAVLDTSAFFRSVRSTAINLAVAGGWDVAAGSLAVLLLLGWFFADRDHRALTVLSFIPAAFIPLGVLLGFLREIPYRVGIGDSLNRMATHVVPIIVVFGLSAIAGARKTETTQLDEGRSLEGST